MDNPYKPLAIFFAIALAFLFGMWLAIKIVDDEIIRSCKEYGIYKISVIIECSIKNKIE